MIEQRMDQLRRLLEMHGGGIELVELTPNGTARLRFTGMCTGCIARPLTTATTVRPLLHGVDGITAVEIEGSRISKEAEDRLAELLMRTTPEMQLTSASGSTR